MSPARRFAIHDEPHLAVRCIVCDYSDGTVLPFHSHEFVQLLYAVTGAMSVHAADSSWIIPPGRAVLIPVGSQHSVRMWGRVALRSLVFPMEPPGVCCGTCRVISVSPLLRELILRAVHLAALDLRVPGERRLLQVILDEIRQAEPLPLALPMPSHPRARTVAQSVLAQPGSEASLDALARQAGAGRRTIERAFRDQTGMSLGMWRQKARLLHAIRMLSAGASVTDTALETGYGGVSAFIAAFRLTFGFTPGKLTALERPRPSLEEA